VTVGLLRVALTGGIATGKSYCLTRFAELGAPTIDADVLAHRAAAPGTPGFDAVVARFGPEILHPHGEIDRARLGRLVFADANARHDLEAIIHPAVYREIDQWFGSFTASGRSQAAIADIPLLFETGREASFDRVIVAACPAETQVTRVMARNKLSEAEARQRVASQMPIQEKRQRADFVIDTSGERSQTDAQVRAIWNALLHGQ
jgi:dephospho-CoA kinase